MSTTDNTTAGVNVLQSSGTLEQSPQITQSSLTQSPQITQSTQITQSNVEEVYPVKVLKPKNVKGNFSIPTVMAAAFIFIVIIAWFEVIRQFLEYAFAIDRELLYRRALANMIYAVVATVIVIILMFLLYRFWMKDS